MNKKLIAAIIAGIIAVALIVVGIVFVAGDISFGGKGDDKKPSSSQSAGEKDPSNKNDDTSDKKDDAVENVETEKSQTVEVPVTVAANDGFVGAQLYFEFDASVLTYVGYSNGELLDECDVNLVNGQLRCIVINDDVTKNVKDAGVLVTLKFKVNDDAAAGQYEVKLGKETMFADSTEKIITPEVTIAKIDVK